MSAREHPLAHAANKPWDDHAYFDTLHLEDGVVAYRGETSESPTRFAINLPIEQLKTDLAVAQRLPPPTLPPETLPDLTTLPITPG